MFSTKNEGAVIKARERSVRPGTGLLVLALSLGLVLGGCSQSETPQEDTGKEKTAAPGKLYESSMISCATFTADDAAAILGIPAQDIEINSQELYAGSWLCSYKGASRDEMVGFSISTVESVQDAITDMAQYRSHLETARGVEPFKEDLKKGAYTDISDVGDDALWTAANGTLTVRKGNVSIQVQLPKDRETQMKVAETFLAKL